MRLLFVVLAGAIGWLWFAVRAPAAPPPPPSPYVRQADLTGLGAQVAAARRAVIPALTPAPEPEPEPDEPLEEEPELEDLEEQALLAVFDQPPPRDAIDLSAHDDYREVIVIEGLAPSIDQTSVRSCGVGVDVVNIPVPARTFEHVLETTSDEVVSISSETTIENLYIVDQ